MSTITERAALARERKKREEAQRKREEARKKAEEAQRQLIEEQKLKEALREGIKTKRAYDMLDSELIGLYEEMDKFAKKALNEPITPLQLKVVNNFVKKAKFLLSGDTIIDEVEVFVAAGDNPEYRDIVTVLRQLRQGLNRFKAGNSFIFGPNFTTGIRQYEIEDEEIEDYFAEMNKPQDGATE